MRWLCTACQVEWTSTGEDHGPCFECNHVDHVKEIPGWEYTHWRHAAGRAPDYDRSEAWRSRP